MPANTEYVLISLAVQLAVKDVSGLSIVYSGAVMYSAVFMSYKRIRLVIVCGAASQYTHSWLQICLSGHRTTRRGKLEGPEVYIMPVLMQWCKCWDKRSHRYQPVPVAQDES